MTYKCVKPLLKEAHLNDSMSTLIIKKITRKEEKQN